MSANPSATRVDPTGSAGPGRKRSQASRLAILHAAFELFGQVGYSAVTTRAIAARAGCGRATIFRWWPAKGDVLLEALAVKADTTVPTDDQGSLRAELATFLDRSFALSRRPHIRDLLCALMAEAQIDPEFGERFYQGFLAQRRAALSVILDRAARRGDLPSRVRPDTFLDLVFGIIWYRVLATREPLDDVLLDELLTVLGSSAPGRLRERTGPEQPRAR